MKINTKHLYYFVKKKIYEIIKRPEGAETKCIVFILRCGQDINISHYGLKYDKK